jgi:hypothetical protein
MRSARRPIRRATALWIFAAISAGAAPVRAEPTPNASLHIWFRTSEGCPDGTSFLEQLRGLGRDATLAGVGDRIDFVVTLAAQPDASAGRLERQTERGTVAIRELHAAHCEEVAEGIALSLDLALRPATGTAPSSSAAEASPALPASPGLDPRPAAPGDATLEPRPSDDENQARARPLASRWGAQASLETGLVPFVIPGGALFAELASGGGAASARLSARAAYGRGDVEQTELRVTLFAARLDGCALGWHSAAFSIDPCLAADLGTLRASTPGADGRSDQGLWLSAAGLVRASLPVSGSVAFEAQLGAVFPVVRYSLSTATGTDLFRTEPVGVDLSVGARWSP